MQTIALNGTGTTQEVGAATSTAVPYPAVVPAGAVAILWMGCNSSLVITSLGGVWTDWERRSRLGSTAIPSIYLATKVTDGTEGGTSVTVTHPNAASISHIEVWTGVDTVTPLDVAIGENDNTATNQATAPTITPVTANVALAHYSSNNANASTSTPPSAPGTFTEIMDGTGTRSGAVSYLLLQPASATGAVTATWSLSGAGQAYLVALRPGPDLSQPPPRFRPGKTWRRRFKHPQRLGPAPAPAGTSATVAGSTPPDLTIAAPVGTVAGPATIAGPLSTITVAAPVGTVSGPATVAGPLASVAIAAPAGTVSGPATVAGPLATIAIAAPVGTVSGSANIAGAKPNVTIAAPAGTVSGPATVAGPVSTLVIGAPAGTVSAGSATPANVAGLVSAVTIAAPAGTVAGPATVAGPLSAVTIAAPAGTVAGQAKPAGPVAALALTAPAGTVSAPVVISGPLTGLTISAKAGTVTGPANIAGPLTTLTVTAFAGTVAAGGAPGRIVINDATGPHISPQPGSGAHITPQAGTGAQIGQQAGSGAHINVNAGSGSRIGVN